MKINFLEEISLEEMSQINGGASITNWSWRQIGKGTKYLQKVFVAFSEAQVNGHRNIGGPTANHG